MKEERGRRDIAILIHNLAAAALSPRRDPVHIAQEAEWASGSAWTNAENLASTGVRTPGCPDRSELLPRLHYISRPRMRNS